MKLRFSLPSNQQAFNRYAKVYKTFKTISWICQLISIATAISIVANFFYGKLSDFLPDFMLAPATVGLALLCTFSIEAISRVCTEEVVKNSLQFIEDKFKNTTALDFFITALLLVGMVVGLGASAVISFKGGKEVGHTLVGSFDKQSTNEADSIHQYQTLTLNTQYRKDSAAIANNYTTQINAIPAKYANKISAAASKHQREINSLTSKLNKANPTTEAEWIKKLKTQRFNLQKRQKSAKQIIVNNRETEKSKLETEKAQKLFDLLEDNSLSIKQKNADHTRETTTITAENESNKANHFQRKSSWGDSIGWFTVIILLIFVICIVVVKTIEHLCGMKEEVSVTTYFFMPTIASEFKEMVAKWYNWAVRSLIAWMANKKPPPLPTQEVHYDYDSMPSRVNVRYLNSDTEMVVDNGNPTHLKVAAKTNAETPETPQYGFSANPESRPLGFEDFDEHIEENQKAKKLDGQVSMGDFESYNWLCLNIKKYTKRVADTRGQIPKVASNPERLEKTLEALQNRQTRLAQYQMKKAEIAKRLGLKE